LVALYPPLSLSQLRRKVLSDAYGNTPTADGSNYRNIIPTRSAPTISQLKYDAYLSDKITWSNQVYFHHNDGVGVVAGWAVDHGDPGLISTPLRDRHPFHGQPQRL
jgi:hypothetical protein